MPATGMITGTIAEFDEHRGWGTVRGEAGDEHFFHCTAIANGTRTIPVDTPVRYRVLPGRLGRWEAAEIAPR